MLIKLLKTKWFLFFLLLQQVLVASHGEKDEAKSVVDFRGNPIDKSKTGGWLAAGLILGAFLVTYMKLS